MPEPFLVFLRPLWLWGYLPLLIALIVWLRHGARSPAWEPVVDAALMPYVVEAGDPRRRGTGLLLFGGWALALFILSGPVREQQPVPVFEARRAQVVLFDLSRSMLADDLAPSRLVRSRFKLADLLKRSGASRTGLVAFAERPYTISPLTDDAATLEAFLTSLEPTLMPAQGSRVDLAIARGVELLAQGGVTEGHLILITDAGIDARDIDAARAAREAGHVVSVLGAATPTGVPLRGADGQFLRRADGSIVVPQLDRAGLDRLARAGGGVSVTLSGGMQDIDAIAAVPTRIVGNDGRADEGTSGESDAAGSSARERYWIERAPWLIPLLALLSLGLFRRGVIA